MITKTYECKNKLCDVGQFNYEFDNNSEELKECSNCNQPVTRIFKPIFYTECIGFCGRNYNNK